MSKAKKLREMLTGTELVMLPGVYDAITARVVEHCNFNAAYITGFGTAAAYGFPDYGLLTMTEMVDNIRQISGAVELPLIADADTGYGNAINVHRTVQEYEKAGAAGVQLEDQAWPKRCGHMEGKAVIPSAEMIDKVRAAVEARLNPDTVIVARTDAIAIEGFDQALERAHLYSKAGADVLFIEAPENMTQIKKIPRLFNLPCLINLAFGRDDLSCSDLELFGYKFALFPVVTMLGAVSGAMMMCEHLKKHGRQKKMELKLLDFEELNLFLGLEKYRRLGRKFASHK